MTYKILPLKESNSDTLQSYLESYLIALKGFEPFKELIPEEPRIIDMITIMEFFKEGNYSTEVCRKEVFKCIRILNAINKKYFEV